MFGITDLTTYLIGTILIILLPGPNSLYVTSVASRFGKSAGYRATLGVLTGDTILMLLTIFGAASLLQTIPMLFLGLKLIGALYLGWLGYQLLHAAYLRWQARTQIQPLNPQPSLQSEEFFHRAMMISLLNPKAILFFLSFFIQFVDPNYAHPSLSFLILGVLLQALSFAYLSSLIFTGIKLANFFNQYLWIAITGIVAVGMLFLGFAVKLLFSTL